jgi:hypothetical protein
VVVDDNVGIGEQSARSVLAGWAVEVNVRAARADVGLGVYELVFVVVRAGGTQHVRSLLGECPTNGWAGDGMGEGQRADPVEGPLGRSEVLERRVADALETDSRLARKKCSLLVGEPFSRAAHYADRQTDGARRLLQFDGVPPRNGCGDPGGIGGHV